MINVVLDDIPERIGGCTILESKKNTYTIFLCNSLDNDHLQEIFLREVIINHITGKLHTDLECIKAIAPYVL